MAALLISILAVASIPVAALLMIRRKDQAVRDRQRRTYRLIFPTQLTEEQVVAWLRAIAGTLNGRGIRPTIAFETWASSTGIEHRLRVPWPQADFIVGQLRSLVSGIRVTPEDEHPHRLWTTAVEVGLSNSGRPLRIYDSANLSASMLAALQPLGADEVILTQWVVAPARPAPLPIFHQAKTDHPNMHNLVRGTEADRDEINERRAKLAEPNVLAILRVAATAKTKPRAEHLVDRVRATLSATRTASTRFTKRLATLRGIQRRIDDVVTPQHLPMQLAVPEFAALMAWPIGDPLVPGLPPAVGKQYPPNDNILRQGIVLGSSTFPGAERPIALGYQEALMHTWLGGSTGCLHPDTPIYDPVADTTRTVRQRYDDGVEFHVYAKHGQALVVARAEAPQRFRRSRMYRIYNEEHQIVVTPEHRVWDGRSWVEVGDFVRGDSIGVVRLPSISVSALSRLRQDARHLRRTHEDFQGGCLTCCRLCGQLPHAGAGSGQALAPSLGGAPAPCCSCVGMDVPESRPRSSHPCPSRDRQPRSSSSRPCSPAHATNVRFASSTCKQSSGSTSSASQSASSSSRRRTADRLGRSAPVSKVRTVAPSELPDQPSCTDWRQPREYSRPPAQSDTCSCLRLPADESSCTSPRSRPLWFPSFSSYSKYTTFMVEQEEDETYYDFHVPNYENYLAGGLINHNTGKTSVMANMARQIMDDGYGLIVIEQAGDLYQSVLDYVPKHRMDDVVLLDVSDYEHPVGFNVLDQGEPLVVIDQIIDLFNHKYTKSMWAEEYIWHGLRTIAATPGLAFTDLPTLLVPRSDEAKWADSVQRNVNDPELHRWWQRQDNRDRAQQQQRADPVLSRVWQLASRPELRLVMGQSKSTFQVSDVLRDNKILLVNLKGVSSETASLAGTLMMNAVWYGARSVQKDKPTYVLLDEFADFMDLPVDTETMLAQARKHKVGMILANQHLGQLPQVMREAVLTNARSKLVLATSADDARVLSREMGHSLEPVDFTSLQQYEAMAQVLTPYGVGQPVSIRTVAPPRSEGNAASTRARSRARYSRPRAEVYTELEQRHRSEKRGGDGPPPVIGGA